MNVYYFSTLTISVSGESCLNFYCDLVRYEAGKLHSYSRMNFPNRLTFSSQITDNQGKDWMLINTQLLESEMDNPNLENEFIGSMLKGLREIVGLNTQLVRLNDLPF